MFFHSNIDRLIQYEYLYSDKGVLPIYVRRRFGENGIHSFKQILVYQKDGIKGDIIILLRDDGRLFRLRWFYKNYKYKLQEIKGIPYMKFKTLSINLRYNIYYFVGVTNDGVYIYEWSDNSNKKVWTRIVNRSIDLLNG